MRGALQSYESLLQTDQGTLAPVLIIHMAFQIFDSNLPCIGPQFCGGCCHSCCFAAVCLHHQQGLAAVVVGTALTLNLLTKLSGFSVETTNSTPYPSHACVMRLQGKVLVVHVV